MSQPDLIIHDEKDNVGVVVIETTKKGQECSAWIMENDKTVNVSSINEKHVRGNSWSPASPKLISEDMWQLY